MQRREEEREMDRDAASKSRARHQSSKATSSHRSRKRSGYEEWIASSARPSRSLSPQSNTQSRCHHSNQLRLSIAPSRPSSSTIEERDPATAVQESGRPGNPRPPSAPHSSIEQGNHAMRSFLSCKASRLMESRFSFAQGNERALPSNPSQHYCSAKAT